MATEKILNTRIQLKYDTYANWTSANTLLKQGEVAIATLASSVDPSKVTPDNGTHPVLMKVGPGNFNSLPWMSALAADVHAWAKKTEAEFTAWVGTLPNTITLNVNNVDKKYSIEDAIKLVRSEITAGGEAAAITVTAAHEINTVKYNVEQGGVKVEAPIIVKAGDGLTTSGNTLNLDAATKTSLGKADSAVQHVGYRQYLNNPGQSIDMNWYVDDETYTTTIGGDSFVTVSGTGGDVDCKGENPGEITIGIDSTKFSAAVKTVEVDKAVEAGKTTKALTVKVGGNDVVFDGSAAKTADVDAAIAAGVKEAKDYADAKPHENTAHTHSHGLGTQATANGGIEGDVAIDLHLEFLPLTADNKLQLVDKSSKSLVAEFDASSFVEDSYLKSVTYSDTDGDNKLTFVFELNNGETTTVDVDLSHLVDVYTADNATIILETSEEDGSKIFKIKEGGVGTTQLADGAVTADKIAANAVTTAKIADKNVTEAKLADAVATKINNALTSVSVTKADLGVENSEHVALSFGGNDGSEYVEFHFKGGDHTSAVIDDSYTLNANGEADHAIEIRYDVAEASAQDANKKGVVSFNEMHGVAQAEIAKLDKTVTGMSAAKTLKSLTETDGIISATFQDIKIEPSQVNNLIKTIQDNSIQSVHIAQGADLDEYESDGKTVWALKADDNIVVAFADSNTVKAQTEFDVNAEGKYYAKFGVKDHAIGAQHLKAEQGYTGSDAEVWVFNCGSATEVV